MQNKFKKAVDFQEARVKAGELQAKADNAIIKQYISSRLANSKKGDLISIPLPKNKLMKLEVIEEGLYSGWVQDALNNDILYHLDKATLNQIVQNIASRDPELQIKEKKEEPRVINININLGKSIDDFINMTKGKNTPKKDFVGQVKPKKPEEEKEVERKQRADADKSKEKNMDRDKLKKAVKNAFMKSIQNKPKKLWELQENEDLNKSVEALTNGSTDIPSWDDEPRTEQAKLVNDNIQKSIKNK